MPYTEIALQIIKEYGYLGLGIGMLMEFTGLPFPGELALGFAGFLIWREILFFAPAWSVVLASSWLGSMLAYFLGVRLGRPFILHYGRYVGLNEKKITQAENWFSRHRVAVLVLGRFISGVRPLSAYVAGMAGMSWLPFSILSFLGTAIWTSTYLYLGYLLGVNWEKLVNYSPLLGLAALLLSLLAGLYIWYRRKHKVEIKK